MKNIALSILLIGALALSACEQQSEVNQPVSGTSNTTTLLKAVENLDLSNEQMLQLEEMFWMEEDMTLLLDPAQTRALNVVIDGMSPGFAGDRDPRRIGFDMGALMHLRLIIKANPDLDEETKEKLIELIKASNEERMKIIEENRDNPELLRELLKKEHDDLIKAMNALLSEEELENVEELKEEIRKLREELRQKWVEMRIDHQLRIWKQMLDLTEEQVEAIRKILLDQHEAIRQARIDNAGNPEALREKMKEILQGTDEDIRDVLDEEQEKKWDLMKKMRLDWRRGHRGGGVGPRG